MVDSATPVPFPGGRRLTTDLTDGTDRENHCIPRPIRVSRDLRGGFLFSANGVAQLRQAGKPDLRGARVCKTCGRHATHFLLRHMRTKVGYDELARAGGDGVEASNVGQRTLTPSPSPGGRGEVYQRPSAVNSGMG